MKTATTTAIGNNPTGATHPPILIKLFPDGKAALESMDPSYKDWGERDLAKLYPFRRSGTTFVCKHHKTGEELDIKDANARTYVAQAGAGQWINLYNLMQAFFIHQSGPRKGRQDTTVRVTLDNGSEHEFHNLESATAFLSDRQAEWEEWGKGA